MTTGAKMIPYVRIEPQKPYPIPGNIPIWPIYGSYPLPFRFPVVSCVFIFLRKLDILLKPDQKRAAELKEEFAKGFNGIIKRIWPHVNLVLACSTGILNY